VSTNPYQTPEGQLSTDDQSFGEVKFFSPSSRINRLRYWAHSMLFSFAMIGVFIVIGLVAALVSTTIGIVLGVIAYIVMIVFSFILMIQRLHDLNKTGWMSLLCIVPLANIYLLVLLIFFKGTEGRNNYGLKTPPNKTWHWVMALSLPVFIAVIGILAAIALPAYQDYVTRTSGLESSYNSQDIDGYPSEYTEESTTDESLYTDEAIVDGLPVDEEITDEPVEESTESETPQ